MRRMLALAGATLTALTFAVAPAANAAPASAAPAVVAAVDEVNVFGTMFIKDDDPWPDPDDYGRQSFNETRTVSTFGGAFVEVSKCVGGEVRGELHVQLQRRTDGWIHAIVDAYLYEWVNGTQRCGGDDLDGHKHEEFDVAPGASVYKEIKVTNGEWNAHDKVENKFTVTNS